MSFLKKSYLWIILLLCAGYGTYFFINLKGPCETPIEYSIGTFDTQFTISKSQFLVDINQAAQIWDKVLDKKLFAYDATGTDSADMPINLIYDSRQENANTNKNLSAQVDVTQQSADSLKSQFTALQTQLDQEKTAYDTQQAQVTAEQTSYNSEVDAANSRGGATPTEYQKFTAEKNQLVSAQNALEQKRLALNAQADQINGLIAQYNSLVKNANSTINTINQNADQQFEEGEYLSDATGERINIYEFENQQNLVRVLAHELGHSLGLNHNSNPDSIMYYLNSSSNMVPTADDVAALKAACHIQ